MRPSGAGDGEGARRHYQEPAGETRGRVRGARDRRACQPTAHPSHLFFSQILETAAWFVSPQVRHMPATLHPPRPCLLNSPRAPMHSRASQRRAFTKDRQETMKQSKMFDKLKIERERQGLTLAHFSAQRRRFVWDRGCIQGLCRGCLVGVRGYQGMSWLYFVSGTAQVEPKSGRV